MYIACNSVLKYKYFKQSLHFFFYSDFTGLIILIFFLLTKHCVNKRYGFIIFLNENNHGESGISLIYVKHWIPTSIARNNEVNIFESNKSIHRFLILNEYPFECCELQVNFIKFTSQSTKLSPCSAIIFKTIYQF